MPDRRMVMPLAEDILRILSEAMAAIDILVTQKRMSPNLECDANTSNFCQYRPSSPLTAATVNQQVFSMRDESILIPLRGLSCMSALRLEFSGQLTFVVLHQLLAQFDIVHLYHMPCAQCLNRFDEAVKRYYSSTINFPRLISMFTARHVPPLQALAGVEQQVVTGRGPGGPDDFPVLSGERHDVVFPGTVPSGKQAMEKDKEKEGGQARPATHGAVGILATGHSSQGRKKRVRWKDLEEGDNREPREGGSESYLTEEKQEIRKKISKGYKKIIKATSNLVQDMEDELEHLQQRLTFKRKQASHPNTIAKENRVRLKNWRFFLKEGRDGIPEKVKMKDVKKNHLVNLKVQREAVIEEYVIEPETGTVMATQGRRISVVTSEDIEIIRIRHPSLTDISENELPAKVFEEELSFSAKTPKLIASGDRRASLVAHTDVEVLRNRLDSLLNGEKEVEYMTRWELHAASRKIGQLLDDKLILRYEELDRLDQGRARLAQEIIRKKQELDKLHTTWFGEKAKQAELAEKQLEALNFKAQKVCEEYAGMHAYDRRYRHWAGSLIQERFDSAAHERLQKLNQAQEKVLGYFQVGYFGRHWKNLAAPWAGHPKLSFIQTNPPAVVEAVVNVEQQGYFSAFRGSVFLAVTSALGALGLYYFSDEIYEVYAGLPEEQDDDEKQPQKGSPYGDP